VIAISRIGSEIQDVWITEEPAEELENAADGETVELRLWSGRSWRNTLPGGEEYEQAIG
jgi:hypothetical protein